MDVDRYFERIGYSGSREPTLATLSSLHLRHPAAIPFENLDPLLRRPVRLDLESLQHKLVESGRGGYCYEHNVLFASTLRQLGFAVRGLAARVLWNAPVGEPRPRSHMVLRVDLAGTPYIADVGFGGLTLTAPIRLEVDVQQATPHETFRLTRLGEDLAMQANIRDSWKTLYRFGGEEHLLPDYEMANWYTSTSPRSVFVTSLMAARATAGIRYGLLNNELSMHHLHGATEQRALASAAEIRDALERIFGIALPDSPDLEPALARLVPGSDRSS